MHRGGGVAPVFVCWPCPYRYPGRAEFAIPFLIRGEAVGIVGFLAARQIDGWPRGRDDASVTQSLSVQDVGVGWNNLQLTKLKLRFWV